MTPFLSRFAVTCWVLAAITLLSSPVGATLVLSDAVLSPATIPLVPAMDQWVDAKIAFIPSGATTFVKGHSLQMQTGMMNTTWNMQVYLDGIPAAQQSAGGSAMFVNGYLLSYPTDRDVSVSVSIVGSVPADNAGATITLLMVQELDNSGMPVPGGVVTISQPVAAPAGNPVNTVLPGTTPQLEKTAPVPVPTRAGGFCLVAGLIALISTALFFVSGKKREK
ncbi:MAG: hypothetical protein OS112_01190 [Methanoregula sp.]|nr:MAG: hypothetical protein OS112_01190 [Methanoregula sp.]